MHLAVDPHAVLADPHYFPHRLDFRSRRLLYLRVSAETLASSAFIDGRTPLAAGGGEYVVDLENALTTALDTTQRTPPPMIFHTAFCGSTLLARALTVPQRSICLREPQILADLAAWHATVASADRAFFDRTLAFVLAQLARPIEARPISIKPTNWINPMLAPLLRAGVHRALFLTSELRALLLAALRGGSNRIAYLSRFVVHAAQSWPALSPLIRDATGSGGALDKALRLCALSWLLQHVLFEQAFSRLAHAGRMGVSELVAAPQSSLRQASSILGITLGADAIAASVAATFPHHAKAKGAFDQQREAATNNDLFQHYRTQITGAERWSEAAGETLTPPSESAPHRPRRS